MSQKLMKYFSIRVYAVIINEHNELLIGEEFHFDRPVTKFPGGGLELGEGTHDCLKREAIEEFGQEIEVGDHFYTTDFFQAIPTRPGYQLISVYYEAQFKEAPRFVVNNSPFEHTENKNGSVAFRWVPLGEVEINTMTYPIDQKVVELIRERNGI